MLPSECVPNRRSFLKGSLGLAVGFSTLPLAREAAAASDNAWIVGPQPGFTPEIGTLTSMLDFTRRQVLDNVKGLSQPDLDFLLDAKANTIGAMLLHLAATETYYQMNAFDGMKWDSWSAEVKKKWDIPMNLGEPARKAIKGNSLDYYLNALHQAGARRASPSSASATISGWGRWSPRRTSQSTTMPSGFTSPNMNPTTTARSSS
jgi:hypothetical protein